MKYTIQASDVGKDINELLKAIKPKKVKFDQMFDEFWESGIRKVNKKKSLSLFNNILEKHDYPDGFTQMLIADVQSRLRTNQLGFTEMHPTTYLNGERWNDEIKQGSKSNGQSYRESRGAFFDNLTSQAEQGPGSLTINGYNQELLE